MVNCRDYRTVDLNFSDEEESSLLLTLAAQEGHRLNTGELESAVIAIHREWALATDDKRATNAIKKYYPRTKFVTTPDLVKHWSDYTQPESDVVAQAIQRIQRYVPPRGHALREWWLSWLDDAQ